jgi:hypothetical protein
MSYRIKLKGLALVVLAMVMSIASVSQAGPNWRETTNSKAAESARSGGQCVRETQWMRNNHMVLLKKDRDFTVHEGIRTVDGSLSECVACHSNTENGKHVPVNAMEGPDGKQFCASCHAFTGVKLNCFQCHAAVPTE